MGKFLVQVANKLVNEYGYDLSGHVLVFPNRRSSLFFSRYLAALCDRPVWAPAMMTINDLLYSASELDKAEPLELIFDLFSVFNEAREIPGSFDDFYFWGEMLINDFDDIDKYLVDAGSLFSNLLDIKEIDDRFGGLDEEVVEIIRKFWINFDPSNITGEKADFLSVWGILNSVYMGFREKLRSKGAAYDGMIFRDLAELIINGKDWTPGDELYHIIGFNALNRCEQVILDDLAKRSRAKFYWDYDEMYTGQENHEAGFFLRENLKRYGGEEIPGYAVDNLLNITRARKDWIVINAPSDVAQAKLIPGLLRGMEEIEGNQPDHTAIILADENMLMPVLNSIPPEIEDINITMGYPLYQTPVYSLVNHLIKLQKNARNEKAGVSFYYADVLNLLKHQYLNIIPGNGTREIISRIKELNMIRVREDELAVNDLGKLVFHSTGDFSQVNSYLRDILLNIMAQLSDSQEDDDTGRRGSLQMEYIYSLLAALNQLEAILSKNSIILGIDIYSRILDKILRKIMVPFAGEPLSGLQVMGLLETRLLDFENIIILSVNEGVVPKGSSQNSYIPHNLRAAFGLPTVKHQDSIYAYYFYRLLHNAGKVRFIYNSSSSGLRTGEMSRFLLQLKYNPLLEPGFADSRFTISPSNRFPGSISKNQSISSIISGKFIEGGEGKGLSPSAINTWINCSMRFYYSYVAGLKEPVDVSAEVDSPVFGNILHVALKIIYGSRVGRDISRDEIIALKDNNPFIKEAVEKAFSLVFLQGSESVIGGRNRIIVSILEKIVKQILLVDSRMAPIHIEALEREYSMSIPVITGDGETMVRVRGTIDRVDVSSGTTRILDYKSGSDNLEVRSLDDLTSYSAKTRNSAAFQTLLYCELYYRETGIETLRPSLYPVRQLFNDNFSDHFVTGKGSDAIVIDRYGAVRNQFMEQLVSVIGDILDPGIDFVMTDDRQKCKYCPFAGICEREDVK